MVLKCAGRPGVAGKHQQKRRVGAHFLADVQQQFTDVTIERVRFVDQDDKGALATAGGQPRGQVLHRRSRRRPFGVTDAGDAEFPWQDLADDRRRQ